MQCLEDEVQSEPDEEARVSLISCHESSVGELGLSRLLYGSTMPPLEFHIARGGMSASRDLGCKEGWVLRIFLFSRYFLRRMFCSEAALAMEESEV